MTSSAAPRSEIYDLGYRNYDGPRLGRTYAIRSLCVLSVRNAFSLGQSTLPKVLAFGLTLLAFIPAVAHVVGRVLGLTGGAQSPLMPPSHLGEGATHRQNG